MLLGRSYVNSKGLQNFTVTDEDLFYSLDMKISDIDKIFELFQLWAGYSPAESLRPDKDFEHFIKYSLKPYPELSLKAVFILDKILKRANLS